MWRLHIYIYIVGSVLGDALGAGFSSVGILEPKKTWYQKHGEFTDLVPLWWRNWEMRIWCQHLVCQHVIPNWWWRISNFYNRSWFLCLQKSLEVSYAMFIYYILDMFQCVVYIDMIIIYIHMYLMYNIDFLQYNTLYNVYINIHSYSWFCPTLNKFTETYWILVVFSWDPFFLFFFLFFFKKQALERSNGPVSGPVTRALHAAAEFVQGAKVGSPQAWFVVGVI